MPNGGGPRICTAPVCSAGAPIRARSSGAAGGSTRSAAGSPASRKKLSIGPLPGIALEVHDRLSLEDVEGLLLGGVRVKRSHLATACELLDEQICPGRLRSRRLEREQVVVEPQRLALLGIERGRRARPARFGGHGVLRSVATELLGHDAPDDPRERLDRTIAELIRLTIDTEPELRTVLRLSLEPGPEQELLLRQGRAIGWIEEAPAPLQGRLAPSALRRLVLAIRAACGIEALVWLTDVARLSRRDASELMRWSALALLRAALAEADERERSP